MGHKEHKERGRELFGRAIGFAVITVSDTRDEEGDESGRRISEMAGEKGHRVVLYRIVKDDMTAIRDVVKGAVRMDGVDAVIVNGGTGVSPRDATPESVEPLFEKGLPGFGEVFRYLSFLEIGSPAIMTRASAGIVRGKPVFLLPGSKGAVTLAMEKIILPEIEHILYEITKGECPGH